MKNVIPVITAVLLGLAVVFAVSKTMKKSEEAEEQKQAVLIATGEISAGDVILDGRVGEKMVPVSAMPKNAIDAGNRAFTLNQKTHRLIAKGDYILYSDIELDDSKSRALGDGQWGVPVTFSDGVLLRMLKPGDDIAIIGTFVYNDTIKLGKDADAETKTVSKTVTTVIYPRVTIMEISGSTVLLSMPPQQAIALTAIQHRAKLYPLLRKKDDDTALNRMNDGKFEDSALTDMLKGLTNISIPNVPEEIKE
ncbi:MAG: hypothetical protein IJT83_08050 [Victivallales bacterium]|nr:hypothetical protein [Victivallales bacterium]